jgi:hypothetical protein
MKRFRSKQVRIIIVTLHASVVQGAGGKSRKLRGLEFVAEFVMSDETPPPPPQTGNA